MDSTAAANKQGQETARPKPQMFSLKIPYVKQGRTKRSLAQTTDMEIRMMVNAESDENEFHTHLDLDHTFIVLEGELTIIDPRENKYVVKPYKGILIPKGAYYRYFVSAEENTVMLRISAKVHDGKFKPGAKIRAVRLDGTELGSMEEHKGRAAIMTGKFFAESAGLD
jgi:mannose-6-phosphate isomerase-like protein (cupin superfamily)